jgi:hypothetical protein
MEDSRREKGDFGMLSGCFFRGRFCKSMEISNLPRSVAKSRAFKPDLSGAVNSRGIFPPDELTFSEVSND